MFQLTFPGEKPNQLLSLEGIIRPINGVPYVDSTFLVGYLQSSVNVPLQISGLRNPVLSVGPARLQLGTPEAPVLATNLYASTLLDRLESGLPRIKNRMNQTVAAAFIELESLSAPDSSHQLRVNTPDGTLYGLLSNADFTRPMAAGGRKHLYSLGVRAVQGGLIPAPLTYGRNATPPRLVSSLPELLQATEKGQRALLVYRLQAADLHNLIYTPVPASQIKVQSPQTSGR